MYTGIIHGQGTVASMYTRTGLVTIQVRCPPNFVTGVEHGASVAVDGVCLSCVSIAADLLAFDIMDETLRRTTLSDLQEGSAVNLERSARDGAEIGGHPISGHVDGLAEISAIQSPENNLVMTFTVAPDCMRYIFLKGYIALNGTSLTIASVDRLSHSFQVWFIPVTLQKTTFGTKRVGEKINVEIERGTQVTVDTIRAFLEERLSKMLPQTRLTLEDSLTGR